MNKEEANQIHDHDSNHNQNNRQDHNEYEEQKEEMARRIDDVEHELALVIR